MSSTVGAPEVILTKEHRRFAEFCDACRRYRYIGICYGPSGVGKTLSARHYAHWFHLEASQSYMSLDEPTFAAIVGSDTVFYTPKVVLSPRRMEEEIRLLRNRLHSLAWAKLYREQEGQQEAVRQQGAARLRQYLDRIGFFIFPVPEVPVTQG
jgi:AAA domain